MSTEIKIPIDKKQVGPIIGVGGRVVKAIMFESGALVYIKETDSTHFVLIKGNTEQTTLARNLVEKRLKEFGSKEEETRKECRFGSECQRKNCVYEHPSYASGTPSHPLKSRTEKKRNKNKPQYD